LRTHLIASKIIDCLIDDNYENQVLVWFANFLQLLSCSFGFVLYALIFAISLEIFCILLAYLAALAWEKFSKHLTSFAQMYLLMSTVGYTVLVGSISNP